MGQFCLTLEGASLKIYYAVAAAASKVFAQLCVSLICLILR